MPITQCQNFENDGQDNTRLVEQWRRVKAAAERRICEADLKVDTLLSLVPHSSGVQVHRMRFQMQVKERELRDAVLHIQQLRKHADELQRLTVILVG